MVNANVLLQQLFSGLLLGCIYSLMAMGFSLVFGAMNIANFAHGHLMMVSMYLAYALFATWHWDPILSMVVTAPIVFALGVAIYRLLIQRMSHADHSTHIIATLGLSIVLENVALYIFGGDLRSVVTAYTTAMFPIGSVPISVARSIAAVVSVIVVLGIYQFLHRTPFGKAIRAVADDVLGASMVGIPIQRTYAIAFGLGSAAAAVAGAVMVPFTLVNPFVGMDFLTKSFIIVVLGGVGSVPGALAGGLLIGFLESLGSVVVPGSMVNAITFAILILMLLFKPAGLFGQTRR